MLITRLICINESCHDSYTQFPRSPLGTPGTKNHHLARKHEKKGNGYIFRVSKLKQAGLKIK